MAKKPGKALGGLLSVLDADQAFGAGAMVGKMKPNTDAKRTTRETVPVERGKSSRSTGMIVSSDASSNRVGRRRQPAIHGSAKDEEERTLAY